LDPVDFKRETFRLKNDLKFEVDVHQYLEAHASKRPRCFTILSLQFIGVYHEGTEGTPDADYMRAMTAACLEVWSPDAVIFDFTNLNYKWGNDLAEVIAYPMHVRSKDFPKCLVLSKSCADAVQSLEFAFIDTFPTGFKIYHPTRTDAALYIKGLLRNA
jgi:hypothetical protein